MAERKASRKLGRSFGALKRRVPNARLAAQPTRALFVANGGRVCGVDHGELHDAIVASAAAGCSSEGAGAPELYAQAPSEPYAVAVLPDVDSARRVCSQLHGRHWRDTGPVVYVGYLCEDGLDEIIASQCSGAADGETSFPPGLELLEDFIGESEESSLIEWIDSLERNNNNAGALKHRRVFHFGHEFLYASNSCDLRPGRVPAVPESIGAVIAAVCGRCPEIEFRMDQVTVNVYEPGQGIASHVDSHGAFEDAIVMLSLGSQTLMEFADMASACPSRRQLLLPRRSVCVLREQARYAWKHGIACRKHDVLPAGNRVLARGKRYSVTMRAVRQAHRPKCLCDYPAFCDGDRETAESSAENRQPLPPSLLEERHVRRVYERIAGHFAETRARRLWPAVVAFLDSVRPHSTLLDAGCGSGKYLKGREGERLVKIGCDNSPALVRIAGGSSGASVLAADCLRLPFRSACFDAAICVAVLHHFATEERRRACLQSLLRCVTPAGRILITVWAMEQRRDGRNSSYLSWGKGRQADTDSHHHQPDADTLPVHTNLTEFKRQDLLVPWVKSAKFTRAESGDSSGETFLRFYHVFKEGELEELVKSVDGCELERCFYEQGNWCAVLRRFDLSK